jgi:hypothetical protein
MVRLSLAWVGLAACAAVAAAALFVAYTDARGWGIAVPVPTGSWGAPVRLAVRVVVMHPWLVLLGCAVLAGVLWWWGAPSRPPRPAV